MNLKFNITNLILEIRIKNNRISSFSRLLSLTNAKALLIIEILLLLLHFLK